ncbi:hypothetical protein O3G_MSEX011357 [Manduca sexta]|uniref:SCP domain-containing protein n=1 Tax=Manduca sexta TaxID=7130 RepID=A0A921ZLA6_MANSE|nr:hypothetical protein O3G_MSEX011357 [Manduca sexta]
MITSYPDWSLNPNHQEGRLYLEMIYGPATHMGCGISAYTEYAYYDNNAPLNYNSVQVICNYSSRPRKLGPVYNTMPPTTPGFSSKCGCPPGSEEDSNCLCQESSRPQPTPLKHITRKCTKGDVNCDPTVVVLPIFTMEDAPPHKLISNSYGGANGSITDKNSLEIFDYYEKSEPTHDLINEHNTFDDIRRMDKVTPRATTRSGKKKQILDVKNRYFNRKTMVSDTKHLMDPHRALQRSPQQRRQSVFTRAQTFELPHMQRKQSDNTRKYNVIKKDVVPRKNFDTAQILVKKYMTRKITNDPYSKIKISDVKPVSSENNIHGKNGFTETMLHTAEDKVIDYSRYFNDNNISAVQSITRSFNETANQLIMLCDELEKMVRKIELHGTDKDVVIAKIKKIYQQVVGKPINLVRSDDKAETDFDKALTDSETLKKEFADARTNVFDKYSQTDYNKRPMSIARNQNTLIKGKDAHMDFTDNIKDYPEAKFIVSGNTPRYPTYYADDIKPRNVYKSAEEKSVYANENNDKLKHKIERERITKKYVDFDTYDDPLSPDRRKYYQAKLERLEKKIRNTRRHRNTMERERGVPLVRPTEDLHTPTRSKNQLENTFYPERARFLNGFR